MTEDQIKERIARLLDAHKADPDASNYRWMVIRVNLALATNQLKAGNLSEAAAKVTWAELELERFRHLKNLKTVVPLAAKHQASVQALARGRKKRREREQAELAEALAARSFDPEAAKSNAQERRALHCLLAQEIWNQSEHSKKLSVSAVAQKVATRMQRDGIPLNGSSVRTIRQHIRYLKPA